MEQYHIVRLRSADEAVRLRSVQALADARSVRAVSALIRLLGEEDREQVSYSVRGGMLIACGPGGCRTVPSQPEHSVRLTPVAHALYVIGREALPPQLEDESLEPSWGRNADAPPGADNGLWWKLVQIRKAMDSLDLIVEAGSYEDGTDEADKLLEE